MMISAMALVNRGEVAWIEDPGFYQARRTFGFAGAIVVPRPVDGEGITIARPVETTLAKNNLRNSFPSIPARHDDESRAQNGLDRFRASVRRLRF